MSCSNGIFACEGTIVYSVQSAVTLSTHGDQQKEQAFVYIHFLISPFFHRSYISLSADNNNNLQLKILINEQALISKQR